MCESSGRLLNLGVRQQQVFGRGFTLWQQRSVAKERNAEASLNLVWSTNSIMEDLKSGDHDHSHDQADESGQEQVDEWLRRDREKRRFRTIHDRNIVRRDFRLQR